MNFFRRNFCTQKNPAGLRIIVNFILNRMNFINEIIGFRLREPMKFYKKRISKLKSFSFMVSQNYNICKFKYYILKRYGLNNLFSI